MFEWAKAKKIDATLVEVLVTNRVRPTRLGRRPRPPTRAPPQIDGTQLLSRSEAEFNAMLPPGGCGKKEFALFCRKKGKLLAQVAMFGGSVLRDLCGVPRRRRRPARRR